MQRFKNILVGVDLSEGDRLVSDNLSASCGEAVNRSLWLAARNSARLTFFYTFDVSPAGQRMIEQDGNGMNIVEQATGVLGELVANANAKGISADCHVCFGKSWLEMIRRVLRHKHDLVVAGTRRLGALRSILIGSTGVKLLRKCPCPVWITQPQSHSQIKSVLVAHCLRNVGDIAMELGCSIANLYGAQLHVVHSLEYPELHTVFPCGVTSEKMAQYELDAKRHIETQLRAHDLAHRPTIHIVTDAAEFAILDQLQKHHIELLVMGMIARTGIAGLVTGNTAERLLPQIPCSVLAVKPFGFVSPVTI